jgi:hypothetical protein
MNADEFLARLAFGGTIVSSSKCSTLEIAQASACGRFYVFDSLGYVHRPDEPEFAQSGARSVEANDELYRAYLIGCEDECLPEPATKEAFLKQFSV